jgi:hypothetical protein
VPRSRARICRTPCEREVPAGEGPDEERRELGDVVGQVVGQEPADVDEGRPSLLDAGDDAGEGVVEEHQVRRLTGDVGPRASHGDADVGLVQGGGIIDSVAGHRDDVTSRTQGPRNAELVLGRNPGDDQTVVVEEGGQDALVGGELGTVQYRRFGPAQPYLVGDGRGRRRVVTGHHRHADTGPPACHEGVGDVVARRVLQADQTHQVQVSLGLLWGVRRVATTRRSSDGQHPQPPRRQGIHAGMGGRSVTAQREDTIGCPLDHDTVVDEHRHAAQARVEGEAQGHRVPASVAVCVDPQPAGEGVECRLHGVAMCLPLPVHLTRVAGRAAHGG